MYFGIAQVCSIFGGTQCRVEYLRLRFGVIASQRTSFGAWIEPLVTPERFSTVHWVSILSGSHGLRRAPLDCHSWTILYNHHYCHPLPKRFFESSSLTVSHDGRFLLFLISSDNAEYQLDSTMSTISSMVPSLAASASQVLGTTSVILILVSIRRRHSSAQMN